MKKTGKEISQTDAIPVISEVDFLKKELSYYQKDGLEGSYYALNYQLNKLNDIIRNADISLTGKDKAFERFWLILTQIKEVHSSVQQLKTIIFGDKDKPKISQASFMDEMNKK